MNANTVLNKILTLLSKEEEVKFAYAKLADGTILESPTFDVGENVEVVSEDGTKTPAPDGEHELELTDTEGNVVRIKIITEGGVIKERENVELADVETIEAEPLPGDPTEMAEEGVPVNEEVVDKDAEIINLEEVSKKIEEMSYRIEELEKKLKMAEEIKEEIIEEEMEEEEDKKLDGAPVEMSAVRANSKNNVPTYQNSFLSKLYK